LGPLPRYFIWLFGVVIPLLIGTYSYAQSSPPLLLDKHIEAGLECKACHGTTEPPKAAGMDSKAFGFWPHRRQGSGRVRPLSKEVG
jgi:hypothetical protein